MPTLCAEYCKLVHIASLEKGYLLTMEGNYMYCDKNVYCNSLEDCYKILKEIMEED